LVDARASLVAFARMDGAWLGALDISLKKAKTARYFDMPTGDLGQPGGPAARSSTSKYQTAASSLFPAASCLETRPARLSEPSAYRAALGETMQPWPRPALPP